MNKKIKRIDLIKDLPGIKSGTVGKVTQDEKGNFLLIFPNNEWFNMSKIQNSPEFFKIIYEEYPIEYKTYLHSDDKGHNISMELIEKGVNEELAKEISNFFYEVEFNISINKDGTYTIELSQ